ncbi:hypothetical protein B0J14DRAFT_655389 [Halenospora varia]|nr:hypothetical protein B0J14DRAFT_655389 [Halenospora varia]
MALCTNSSSLVLAQPSYISMAAGRACVVSTNFTTTSDGLNVLADSRIGQSILQSCCGTNVPIANFTSGANCGFTYCNVTDLAAENGFMACMNQSARGIVGKCFASTILPASKATDTAKSYGAGKRELLSFGLMAGFVVAVTGLGIA